MICVTLKFRSAVGVILDRIEPLSLPTGLRMTRPLPSSLLFLALQFVFALKTMCRVPKRRSRCGNSRRVTKLVCRKPPQSSSKPARAPPAYPAFDKVNTAMGVQRGELCALRFAKLICRKRTSVSGQNDSITIEAWVKPTEAERR